MRLSGEAQRLVRRAIRWERRTLGIAAHLSPQMRVRTRQLLGVGSIQEGRRYAPAGSLPRLFETLSDQRTDYVVLRWFNGLPQCVDGDIDFLVADDSLPQFEALLQAPEDGIPCDVYSESGVPGYRYAGMPYLPPAMARQILARRVQMLGPVSVPCNEDHFVSLAYHAVYQKGLRSGLPTSMRCKTTPSPPLHDYRGTLTRLADMLHLKVEISMEGLDKFLTREGWCPEPHVLRRLARHNNWLRERVGSSIDFSYPRQSGTPDVDLNQTAGFGG